jgi:hypothetical protein
MRHEIGAELYNAYILIPLICWLELGFLLTYNLLIKVKLSFHMPGQVLRSPELEAPTISRQQTQECGKVAGSTYRLHLHLPGDIPGNHLC